MPSSLLQVVNSLFQTCYNNWEQAVRTQQLVNRFVTNCLADLFLRVYTRKNLTACQQDVFALLVPNCGQVWNKLLSSCNKVDEANRLATSCPTSLISSARNKLLTSWWEQPRIATCYEQPVLVLLEQLVASQLPSSTLYNKMITTCSRLVTTTGNKQCEHILISAWQQPCYNLFTDLKQLVRFYVCMI
jgi:hypothetical protein